MKIVRPLFIALLIISVGCSSAKKTGSNPTKASNDSSQKKDNFNTDNYSLIVSFTSIGEGIDGKANNDFLAYIHSFEKFEMTKISIEEVRWGREGEVDYCMKLEELYATQFVRFVAGTKDLLKKNKLVQIYENKPCLHKR